jgi:hypothetical protein
MHDRGEVVHPVLASLAWAIFLEPVLFSVLNVLPVHVDKPIAIAPRMFMSHPDGMRDLMDHRIGCIADLPVQVDVLPAPLPSVWRAAGFAMDEADIVALICPFDKPEVSLRLEDLDRPCRRRVTLDEFPEVLNGTVDDIRDRAPEPPKMFLHCGAHEVTPSSSRSLEQGRPSSYAY